MINSNNKPKKEYFWQYADLKKRIEEILKDYRKNVDYFFSDLYDSNPDYFPIYKSAKVLYLEFKNDPTTSGVAFYCGPGESNKDIIKKINISQEFIETHTNRTSQELVRTIAKKAKIDLHSLYKEPILMPRIGEPSFHNDRGIGESFASGDAKIWKDDTEKFISNAYPDRDFGLPSSIKKYSSLTEAINDKEITFEIKEAFSCYQHKEYLACAMVLCRALEWSCKLLLDTCDPTIYSSLSIQDRTLNTLANKLESNNLINSYEHAQLKASIDYRNSIAHATPITQIKSNIQHIFSGIKLISQKIIEAVNN